MTAAKWGYALVWRIVTQLIANPFQRESRPVSRTVQTNYSITFPKPFNMLHVPLIMTLTFSSKNLHGDITSFPLHLHAPPVLQRRPLPSYSSCKLCSSYVSFQGLPHWPRLPGMLLFSGLNPALISTLLPPNTERCQGINYLINAMSYTCISTKISLSNVNMAEEKVSGKGLF